MGRPTSTERRRRHQAAWAGVGLAATLLTACDRPRFTAGSACVLNTDCAAPLACELGRCRRQCVDSRDCGAGLRCLYAVPGATVGGSCQLPEEASCSLDSDCAASLVCRFATCTTECVEDRDCPPGATCTDDGAGAACEEPLSELCIFNSDCPEPLICDEEQRCRLECREDRDCDPPRTCAASRCVLPDGGMP